MMTSFQASQNNRADALDRKEFATEAAKFGPGYRNTFHLSLSYNGDQVIGGAWKSSHKDPEAGWWLSTRSADIASLVALVQKLYVTGTMKATTVMTGSGPVKAYAVIAN